MNCELLGRGCHYRVYRRCPDRGLCKFLWRQRRGGGGRLYRSERRGGAGGPGTRRFPSGTKAAAGFRCIHVLGYDCGGGALTLAGAAPGECARSGAGCRLSEAGSLLLRVKLSGQRFGWILPWPGACGHSGHWSYRPHIPAGDSFSFPGSCNGPSRCSFGYRAGLDRRGHILDSFGLERKGLVIQAFPRRGRRRQKIPG